jgi:hypothetical protein
MQKELGQLSSEDTKLAKVTTTSTTDRVDSQFRRSI